MHLLAWLFARKEKFNQHSTCTEPYISAKQHYRSTKEPCIHWLFAHQFSIEKRGHIGLADIQGSFEEENGHVHTLIYRWRGRTCCGAQQCRHACMYTYTVIYTYSPTCTHTRTHAHTCIGGVGGRAAEFSSARASALARTRHAAVGSDGYGAWPRSSPGLEGGYISAKEPCVSLKEPCISAKEPDKSAK